MWTLFTANVPLDWIYIGFENGAYLGFAKDSSTATGLPGIRFHEADRNATCPQFNLNKPNTNIPQANPGVGNRFCRSWYGIDGTGASSTNPITGKVQGAATAGAGYDPTMRAWYLKSMANPAPGAVWSAPYIFSAGTAGADTPLGITATRHVITASGQTLGVFGADYELSSIGEALEAMVSGQESTFTMFVVEDSTQALIAASVPGVAVAGDNQVLAVDCIDEVVKTSSVLIADAGGFTVQDGVILLVDVPGAGLYWVQSNHLIDAYGLNWHVVVCEAVLCDVGTFAYSKSDDVNDVCQPCPSGAVCRGGRWLPYPKKGFWVDMTSKDMLQLDMAECREENNCPGGERGPSTTACFESPANLTACHFHGGWARGAWPGKVSVITYVLIKMSLGT
jgi:hypothetical protein